MASAALITSQSDNGYLAAAALFISLPFFLFGTRTGARRYLVILAVFAAAAAWVGWVNRTMPDTVIGLAGIAVFLLGMKYGDKLEQAILDRLKK